MQRAETATRSSSCVMSFTWSPLDRPARLTRREVFEFSDDIVKALVATDADVWVRWRALCQLDDLPPAQLEPYAKQIVRVLEENPELSYHLLRFGTRLPFKALAQLPTEELSRHVTSIMVMLDDEPEANAIGEPDDSFEMIAMREQNQYLGSRQPWREEALRVLGLLPQSALLPHAARIAQHIEDRPGRPESGSESGPGRHELTEFIRHAIWIRNAERVAALGVMERLPEQVGLHAATIVSLLGHSDWRLRGAAVKALAALPAKQRATTAAAIVPLLEDYHPHAWGVRHAALSALLKFAARDLAPHALAIQKRLLDPDEDVRVAAQAVLSTLNTSAGATPAFTPPMLSPPLPNPANVRGWAYWEKEVAIRADWISGLAGLEYLLQSEHADEFVLALQQRAEWQCISAAAERCYQAGARQVLLMLDPASYPKSLAMKYEEHITLAVDGMSPCLMELQMERLPALVGKTVYLDELCLDEFAEILEMEAEMEADELNFAETFDPDLIRSIWISRSGDVRPSRSYANLVEMISCEEAGTDQTAQRT